MRAHAGRDGDGGGNGGNGGHMPVKQRAGRKWLLPVVLAFLFLLGGFFLGQVAGANTGALPGSEGDPLVTASWVEAKLNAFSQALREEQAERQKLEDRMRSLEGGEVERPVPATPGSGAPVYITTPAPVYEVVVLQAGTRLLTGSGTEFILRSGRAVAVAGEGGGIADLTAGKDLQGNETLPRDHLLLSPKDDGRGAFTETDAIFMIRGAFSTEH